MDGIVSDVGTVSIPTETSELTEALQIADQRLYAQKRAHLGRRDAVHQALLQALYERAPELRYHTDSVARLAQEIGRRLGLGVEALEHVRQAALLHDIGKIAIPDSILDRLRTDFSTPAASPGPSDEHELDVVGCYCCSSRTRCATANA